MLDEGGVKEWKVLMKIYKKVHGKYKDTRVLKKHRLVW